MICTFCSDARPTKSEDENGDWWIQLDELPTRDENDSPLLVVLYIQMMHKLSFNEALKLFFFLA